MDLKEELKKALEAMAPQIEAAVKAGIEAKCDEGVDFLIGKLEDLIPGGFDNVLLEAGKPKIKADFKAFLLAQADKIS